MTKLIIINNEEDQVSQHDEYVVGPSIHVRIQNHKVSTSLLEAYGLSAENIGDETVLRLQVETSGEHKKQSLILFYAALEIHLLSPQARCLMYQHNSLKSFVNPDIEEGKDVLHLWHKSQGSFFMDSNVAFYLHESGIEIGSNDFEIQHIQNVVLNKIHGEIADRASPSQKRKIA